MRRIYRTLLMAGLVLGLALATIGAANIVKASASKSWLPAKATVIDSAAVKAGKSGGGKIFSASVVYSYTVEGKNYFSTNISNFGYDFLGEGEAYYSGNLAEIKSIIEKYPVENEIQIFYNPDNHEHSIIEKNLKIPVFLPLILGLLIIYTVFHVSYFRTIFESKS